MAVLIGLSAGMLVILAYFLGAVTGARFLCPFSGETGKAQNVPAACCRKGTGRDIGSCGCGSYNSPGRGEPFTKAENDPEKQRQYEDSRKAFEDCMNYSAAQAYERKGADRYGM